MHIFMVKRGGEREGEYICLGAATDWLPRKCSSDAKAKQSRAGAGGWKWAGGSGVLGMPV